jgi:hypothetical protein
LRHQRLSDTDLISVSCSAWLVLLRISSDIVEWARNGAERSDELSRKRKSFTAEE